MEKYVFRSYSKDAFDYDFLNGKLLRTTADVAVMRRKQICLRDPKPEAAGSCLPVSVNGCTLAAQLEKDADKRKELLERSAKLEKRAIKKC